MYLTDILRYPGKMWLKEPTLLSYVWNRYYFILDKQGKLSQLDEECAGQFVRLSVCTYSFVRTLAHCRKSRSIENRL